LVNFENQKFTDNLPNTYVCIGKFFQKLTIPQMALPVLADAELAELLEVPFESLEVPTIEEIEKLSAGAISPAAIAYLLRDNKKTKKLRVIKRRFDKKKPMVYQSAYRRPLSRAPYRSSTRVRKARPYRTRRRRKPIVAKVHRSLISSSGNTMKQIRVITRLQNPKGTNTTTRKNLKILDYDQPTVSTSSYSFHFEVSLNDLYDDASYKAIYQYYKIVGLRVAFYPLQNAHLATAQSNSTNPILAVQSNSVITTGSAPRIVIAPDYVSVTDFSNEDDALAHDNAKFHVFNDGNEFSVWSCPKPLDVVGREGVVSSSAPGKSQWLPTDGDGAAIEHRGFRGYVSNLHSAIQIKVMWQFKVAFKGLKA
jgi:hypothetical protein